MLDHRVGLQFSQILELSLDVGSASAWGVDLVEIVIGILHGGVLVKSGRGKVSSTDDVRRREWVQDVQLVHMLRHLLDLLVVVGIVIILVVIGHFCILAIVRMIVSGASCRGILFIMMVVIVMVVIIHIIVESFAHNTAIVMQQSRRTERGRHHHVTVNFFHHLRRRA